MQSAEDLAEYQEKDITQPKAVRTTSSAYFKDFLLRPELNKAIEDVQFEHPSEVQQLCIPKAILGVDILCQAKSGTGKTAVFVLSTLQQVQEATSDIYIVVMVHTKELALQVKNEYKRFVTHFKGVTVEEFYGGRSIEEDCRKLESSKPTIFVGTPGRTLDLLNRNAISLAKVKHFVIDEVDECITKLAMRFDIQKVIYKTPLQKQTLMFTATLSTETKEDCLQFLKDPHIVSVNEERKLTLHGLSQFFVNTKEDSRFKTLEDVLDNTEFTQIVIFTKDKFRAGWLARELKRKGFPAVDIHSAMETAERMKRFQRFKEVKERILVTTNLMARGVDVQDVNVVINYDMPESAETYLHRVGRAGRFETRGKAITFVGSEEDLKTLEEIQARFEVKIEEMLF